MPDISKDYLEYNFKSVLDRIGGSDLFEMFMPVNVLEEAMRETLDELEAIIKAKFTENQGRWKRLAPLTVRQRLRQGFGGSSPILVRSGTLRDNIARGREVQILDDNVLGDVYPEDAQAPYSETGETIADYAERLNAEREFMVLSEEDEQHLAGFYADRLADKLGLTG